VGSISATSANNLCFEGVDLARQFSLKLPLLRFIRNYFKHVDQRFVFTIHVLIFNIFLIFPVDNLLLLLHFSQFFNLYCFQKFRVYIPGVHSINLSSEISVYFHHRVRVLTLGSLLVIVRISRFYTKFLFFLTDYRYVFCTNLRKTTRYFSIRK
jgi:hypothetical protein